MSGVDVPPDASDDSASDDVASDDSAPDVVVSDVVVSDVVGSRQGVGDARLLFRYVTGDEWQDYRAIMSVFAGTFFSEFTPEDVAEALAATGTSLDTVTVADRLESLRRWGNLTVSSATGTPSSLSDYYRRRNRYLITQAGQEVHDAVERVLGRVDEVHDISTGRLRALLHALEVLESTDVTAVDPERLADLVRAVFDPHEAFTAEITQFFAAVNQWQNRFDLTPEEFSFFAQVLVGYVSERLEEIERMSRPLGIALAGLTGRVPVIVERANRGLAGRVEAAGLDSSVSVTRHAGSSIADWEHLSAWFVSRPGRDSRIERLSQDAVAAVRSLTLNLIRLSRVGAGASSRRGDFLRLASAMAATDAQEAARMATAAFGLHAAVHYGAPADDLDDPVSPSTSWWSGPIAQVPVSLRARGDMTSRGRTSPIPDRGAEVRILRRRRELERASRASTDSELLSLGALDGCHLSDAALGRLEQLVGRALARLPVGGSVGSSVGGSVGSSVGSTVGSSVGSTVVSTQGARWGVGGGRAEIADGDVACTVERSPGRATVVSSAEGTLSFLDLHISLRPARPIAALPATRVEEVAG